ncbi:MAG TPA: hypothetical protein VKE22_04395 [Haliangiales bacterium]|nr:hypothetical protein [Haliangiales bacterium]
MDLLRRLLAASPPVLLVTTVADPLDAEELAARIPIETRRLQAVGRRGRDDVGAMRGSVEWGGAA